MTIKKLAGLAVAMMLAACGAGDGASTGQTAQVQQKTAVRMQKSQAADYQVLVQQLYVAYFGRPADPGGLANFSAALQTAGAPTDIQGLMTAYGSNAAVKQLVDSFGTSAESSKLYGSGSTGDFVTAIFQNVLGRAPQQAGLTYWRNAIDSGALTRGDAALAIMEGALTNTTDQGKLDAQLIQNRLTVAAQFTDELQVQGISGSYAGATAASSARSMLGTVGTTADLLAYESAIVTTVSEIAAGGSNSLLEPLAGMIDNTGAADGLAMLAGFNSPGGLARASNGDLYVADRFNHTIRKISNGMVTTVAGMAGVSGSADGVGAAARFNMPSSVAIDSSGNIYVADLSNDTVRKITPAGVVTTIAGIAGKAGSLDGPVSSALLYAPLAITLDSAGNVYVLAYCAIRKIAIDGTVSTLAGQTGQCAEADGVGAAARFNMPAGIANDSQGNLYVADGDGYTIRKIGADGTVTTIAGRSGVAGSVDANGANARFTGPGGIYCDASGNLYVTDVVVTDPNYGAFSSRIRKITSNGDVTTNPGTANFGTGLGIAVDSSGNVYFSELAASSSVNGGTVDMMTPSGTMTALAGQPWRNPMDGQGIEASFTPFLQLGQDNNGNLIAIDETKLREVSPAGIVTTLVDASSKISLGNGVAYDTGGNAYVTDDFARTIWKISSDGTVNAFVGSGAPGRQDGTGSSATFTYLHGIVFDGQGTFYVADGYSIRKVTTSGVVTTLTTYAGDFSVMPHFVGVALDPSGNVFVSDSARHAIYKITPSGQLSLLAGTPISVVAANLATLGGSADGAGSQASFYEPSGITLDSAGNLYVADYGNSTIRKVTPLGLVSTVAGVAGQAGFAPGVLPGQLNSPQSLVLQGRTLYVSGLKGVAVLYNLP